MKSLTALLLSTVLISPAFAWNQKAMNEQVDQTSFLVDRDCSGTLIDKDKGLFLTANHCVQDKFQDVEKDVINDKGEVEKRKFRITVPGIVSQKFFKGTSEIQTNDYNYKVIAHDDKLDLGLIKTEAKLPNTMSAPVACQEPERGDIEWAVGNPYVALYATVTTGIVSSIQRNYQQLDIENTDETEGQDNGFFQFTSPIDPGSSGGAIYNDTGALIGVVVRGGSNVGLGVPLADIKKFLADNDVKITCQ